MNCNSKVISNEEVVEELTKDIEKSCTIEPTYSESDSNVTFENTNEQNDENKNLESSCAESEDLIPDQVEDELFINIRVIEERDSSLSEEQKQNFQKEAENFKLEGNKLFKEKKYSEAADAYTKGLKTCPLIYKKDRAILFANRAAALVQFQTTKDSAIADCTKAIELDPDYVKAYLRRARFYEQSDKLDEALADYQKVLTFDSHHTESIHAIKKLEPMINEKNEKLKAEMLEKLKDIGNAILKPFGLSTNNFQMKKDESSGSYSINFNQNPT